MAIPETYVLGVEGPLSPPVTPLQWQIVTRGAPSTVMRYCRGFVDNAIPGLKQPKVEVIVLCIRESSTRSQTLVEWTRFCDDAPAHRHIAQCSVEHILNDASLVDFPGCLLSCSTEQSRRRPSPRAWLQPARNHPSWTHRDERRCQLSKPRRCEVHIAVSEDNDVRLCCGNSLVRRSALAYRQ